MRHRIWISSALVVALAACGVPVPESPPSPTVGLPEGLSPDAQLYPDGHPYRVLAAEELPVVGVMVDSAIASAPKERMLDGNLTTVWTNGGYRNPTSWAAVELAAPAAIGAIALKTGTSPAGTSYDVQTSDNGTTWTTRLANQTNVSWNLETKTFATPVTAKFVRIFWRNSTLNPQPHFSIYELEVSGTTGPAPSPTPVPSATPSPVPTSTPQPIPSSSSSTMPPPTGTVQKLPTPASVSTGPSYQNLSPLRAIDGNLTTQWATGEYKPREAFYQLNYNQNWTFSEVRLKTGTLPSGVTFRIEVSDDSVNWRQASGNLTNATWNLEKKPVSGTGRYIRVRFFNSTTNPMARFTLYEFEVYGRSMSNVNRPPSITSTGQTPMKIAVGGSGDLFVQAVDPDNDPLTYIWSVGEGTASGPDSRVSYTHNGYFNPYEEVNRTATVTIYDGRGGMAQQSFLIDLYLGSNHEYAANEALEWAPANTVSAPVSGNATVTVSGDMSTYNGVICEYSSNDGTGRKMVILQPGTNTLPNAGGTAYCYLLKYPVPDSPEYQIPPPNLTLNFSSAAGTVSRTLTNAQVSIIPENKGFDLYAPMGHGGSPTSQFMVGENSAFNGAGRPYHRLLWVYQSLYGYEDSRIHVEYKFAQPGDRVHGWGEGLDQSRLFFTDSTGGAADNTGTWRVYELYYD